MEIYVRVDTENCGVSWYRHERDTGCGSYLCAGAALETTNELGYECLRGSAAKSWKEARRWAKDARMLANADGMGGTRITFWKWRRGKLAKAGAPGEKPRARAAQ